jgi:hypothetical protein
MTKLLACVLVLAATATSTWAAPAERNITCDGAWRPGRVGYCHYNTETKGADIEGVCEMYERCVLRARVVPEISWSNPNVIILRIYAVRKGKR